MRCVCLSFKRRYSFADFFVCMQPFQKKLRVFSQRALQLSDVMWWAWARKEPQGFKGGHNHTSCCAQMTHSQLKYKFLLSTRSQSPSPEPGPKITPHTLSLVEQVSAAPAPAPHRKAVSQRGTFRTALLFNSRTTRANMYCYFIF